ncbi:MAG: S9 family peptidase [Chlorobi bacterium]|nr:S9 family peptidase [Chlorobiota bacterium]
MKSFMTRLQLLVVALITISWVLPAQPSRKVPLNHDVYDGWKSIRNVVLSDDGKWVSYEINPQQGDGWLYLYEVKTARLDSFARGYHAEFMPGSEALIFKIKPQYQATRQAKKAKKKKDEMPKDSLAILRLSDHHLTRVDNVKSFEIPAKEGEWMIYQREKIYPEKPEIKDEKEMTAAEKEALKKAKKEYDEKVKKLKKAKGTGFVVYNPKTGRMMGFDDVTEGHISENGLLVAFIMQTGDSVTASNVSVVDPERMNQKPVFEHTGEAVKLAISKQGDRVAFLHTSDTGKVKIHSLYAWQSGKGDATVICDTATNGMPEGWSVSQNRSPYFSDNGLRLFAGTAPKPESEPEDTLLDEEKHHVDVWNWKDPYLQPMQKLRAEREKKRTYLAVVHLSNGKFIQLGGKDLPDVNVLQKGNGQIALGTSGLPYRKLISWEANRYQDVYSIDVNTGARKKLLTKAPSYVRISPNGKYLIWYRTADSSWYARQLPDGKDVNLTRQTGVNFYNELHDTPSDPHPYGIAGWMDDDKYVLIYDRFDIWKIDPAGNEKPQNLTMGYGRENNIRLRNLTLDREKETISPKQMLYLQAFQIYTKQSGFYTTRAFKPDVPQKLVLDDFAFSGLIKAKEASLMAWRKGSFQQYPELWLSDMKLEKPVKVSLTNPQQGKYLWGSVELVAWNSFDKRHYQGLLYKPENFDPNKKYPMIVYFYERSSDGLHRYNAPAPLRSILNRSYYVSNGYLLFVPDIAYRTGYPGQSAYNSIVSGTQSLLERYSFIDKDRIGLNGQSWGGYQVAYLITQTDMFKCAYSGAPVSDMISAYGGIRWGSGMSRMFQYEQTQSRIGGSLWEKPLHYIENSPIFYVPKVHTPVLIMQNDNDGAVPWYQSIEFFNALRRLNKPAWFLVYNGEGHNLTRRPDMKDLAVREQQFYDHYLKGKPAPVWMVYGIPAVRKGKTDGFELVEDQ